MVGLELTYNGTPNIIGGLNSGMMVVLKEPGTPKVLTLPCPLSMNQRACIIDDSSQPNQLIVKWNDNTTLETGYRIEKGVDGGAYSLLSTEAINTISKVDDVSSDPRHTFIYRIRANSNNGNSQWCSTPPVNYAVGNLQMQGILVR